MLGFLVDIITGVIGFFTSFLPASPFQGISLGEEVGTALGWLNWILPINDMLGIFTLWLAAAIIASVGIFAFKKATGVIGVAGN